MTKDNHRITSYCHIKNNEVSLNGALLFKGENPFKSFIKSAYQYFDTDYPKFFKMDNLSKLAFMAGDVLLKHENISPERKENIAVVFSNRASSLDTDRKHQESIQDITAYYPSPAVFVYTLPNICIGEISIKYKLYSENSFFIFDAFNPDYLFEYSTSILAGDKAEKVLCGWIDFDKGNYEAFLYLVSQEGRFIHSTEEIKRLY
ncbi:3-oxoacyl-ACP synthase [uncultured Kriegella sp.]|uniref:3-oxoacyl-ACP synthase n=1 Tax=uncultured Kriegella sp. TaxID=1798910 RepID=UPI0030DA46ED|tara:strand:+ start:82516 stop:83127 length:612 start_codon:yes stop_codon:yes gene_type:complete